MEEIKCQKCGQNLKLLHWSIGKDILMCDNGRCLAYRNPVSGYSYGNRLENKMPKKSYEEQDRSYAPPRLKSDIPRKTHEEQDGIYTPPLLKSNVSRRPQVTQFQLALTLRCTSLIISGK
jgi:hypothetical protein